MLANAWVDGLVASNLGDYPVILLNKYTNDSSEHESLFDSVLGGISDNVLADIFN